MTAVLPDPFDSPAAPSGRRGRVAVVVAVILLMALVVAVVLARSASSTTGRYRTAVVADHDVESVITGVGSIEPVSQATVAFPIGGTVASVDVVVGDTVTTGQTLATVDTADLVVALHQEQAALAGAELALVDALSGTSASSASSSSGSSGSTTATSSPSSTAGGWAPSNPSIAAAQQAVVAGQKTVDAALAVADQALASSAQVCAAAIANTSTGASSSTDDTVAACRTALQSVSEAQAAVASAQNALASASSTLDALLAQQAAAPSTSPSSPSSSSDSASSSGSSPNGSSERSSPSTSNTSGSTTSSGDLIAMQKAVDVAAADVAVAEQNLAQSTIVTPISGTVAAVDLAVGDSVDAASSTAHIVVVGAGGLEVTTMVSIDDVPDVQVGQRASVLPDGSSEALSGQVVAIALTPATGTTGSTYRVTVGLEGGGAGLGNGATGSVSIVTAGVASALSVPTSAVHVDGDTHSVTVVDGSSTATVEVQVGVVGSTYTEITSGLEAGQVVSLADLDEALPGSATSSSNGTSSTNQRTPFTFNGGGPPGLGGGGR
jgi:multidrug efflux pump subunit AcrA (membrane-fusion protein)